jgi:hypothetical protein
MATESGEITGTKDFKRAQGASRKGGEQGKALLRERMAA